MTGAAHAPGNVHATALVYDGIGVLITGPSGSGKSLLALDLLDHAALAGTQAFLIADDQVLLEAEGGTLRAAAPPTTVSHKTAPVGSRRRIQKSQSPLPFDLVRPTAR